MQHVEPASPVGASKALGGIAASVGVAATALAGRTRVGGGAPDSEILNADSETLLLSRVALKQASFSCLPSAICLIALHEPLLSKFISLLATVCLLQSLLDAVGSQD